MRISLNHMQNLTKESNKLRSSSLENWLCKRKNNNSGFRQRPVCPVQQICKAVFWNQKH